MQNEFAGIRVSVKAVEVGESELCGTEGLPCNKSQEGSRKCLTQKVLPSKWPPFQPGIPSIA